MVLTLPVSTLVLLQDHPIVSAIEENKDRLQMGDISMARLGSVSNRDRCCYYSRNHVDTLAHSPLVSHWTPMDEQMPEGLVKIGSDLYSELLYSWELEPHAA